jgi:hypothetical protein
MTAIFPGPEFGDYRSVFNPFFKKCLFDSNTAGTLGKFQVFGRRLFAAGFNRFAKECRQDPRPLINVLLKKNQFEQVVPITPFFMDIQMNTAVRNVAQYHRQCSPICW